MRVRRMRVGKSKGGARERGTLRFGSIG